MFQRDEYGTWDLQCRTDERSCRTPAVAKLRCRRQHVLPRYQSDFIKVYITHVLRERTNRLCQGNICVFLWKFLWNLSVFRSQVKAACVDSLRLIKNSLINKKSYNVHSIENTFIHGAPLHYDFHLSLHLKKLLDILQILDH